MFDNGLTGAMQIVFVTVFALSSLCKTLIMQAA